MTPSMPPSPSPKSPPAYRIVYYCPDPFLGGNWPVGAVVRDARGVKFIQRNTLPCAKCLGGPTAEASLSISVKLLAAHAVFEDVPKEVGAGFMFGPTRLVHRDAPDARAWVAGLLNGDRGTRSL